MKISLYSTAWGLSARSFDFRGSLDNWAYYANEISIAIGSDDGTFEMIDSYARDKGYPVSLIRTYFDFKTDPYAYGRTENAALQNCNGDVLMQANLDERWGGNKDILRHLGEQLLEESAIQSYFIPTIDLYGSLDKYVEPCKAKWYYHKRGLYRGPVNFGMKPDGRPRYESTSTDELVNDRGELQPTYALLRNLNIQSLREYVKAGMPLVYHIGFLNLKDRATRAAWWSNFWKMATNGDPNNHITDIEELEKRNTFEHNLPLWPTL